jgi:general secretion pathway protein K
MVHQREQFRPARYLASVRAFIAAGRQVVMTLRLSRRTNSRRRQRADRRGVALIMVLGAITVLTVFLTELQQDVSADLAAALAERDALQAEYLARSGVELSRLLIAGEPTIRLKLGPVIAMLMGGKMPRQIPMWRFTAEALGLFNDQAGFSEFATLFGLDASSTKVGSLTVGGFELDVVDEDGKVNPNLAGGFSGSDFRLIKFLSFQFGQTQLAPLFDSVDADGQISDPRTVCAAMIDWVDQNDQASTCDPSPNAPSAAGAEDGFYSLIGMPYTRKNAHFDSLEELRLVRGVSDDFWATFVDPVPEDPSKRNFTVWSQGGKINVNTASADTLINLACAFATQQNPLPLPCTDPMLRLQMQQVLSTVKSFSRDLPMFNNPKEFRAIIEKGIGKNPMIEMLLSFLGGSPNSDPSAPQFPSWPVNSDLDQLTTTSSQVFSIYSTGVVPGRRKTTRVKIHAVVDFRNAAQLAPTTTTPDPKLPPPDGRVIYYRVGAD